MSLYDRLRNLIDRSLVVACGNSYAVAEAGLAYLARVAAPVQCGARHDITTGRYSKGAEEAAFERGAAPITLIDGEKLLELLLKNEIGVNKRQVSYYDFAPEKLAQFETEKAEE